MRVAPARACFLTAARLEQLAPNSADWGYSDFVSHFVIRGLTGTQALRLFFGMALLGLVGAWLAVVRYIESIEIDFDH